MKNPFVSSKRVCFVDPDDNDIYTETIVLTPTEKSSLWYTHEETKQIILQYKISGANKVLFDAMRFKRARILNRRLLKAKKKLAKEGQQIDWEVFAAICQTVSSHRARIAHLQGINDAQATGIEAEFNFEKQPLEVIRAKHRLFQNMGTSK
jgi:hypothetical protein